MICIALIGMASGHPSDAVMSVGKTFPQAIDLQHTNPMVFKTVDFQLEPMIPGGKGSKSAIPDLSLPEHTPSVAQFMNLSIPIPQSIDDVIEEALND
jgi:hypothetical protein